MNNMCSHIDKYDAITLYELGFRRGYSHHLTSQSLRRLGKELKGTLS